jgi:hypothetical protein
LSDTLSTLVSPNAFLSFLLKTVKTQKQPPMYEYIQVFVPEKSLIGENHQRDGILLSLYDSFGLPEVTDL